MKKKSPYGKCLTLLTSLKACDRSDAFSALAPRSLTIKLAMSHSSTFMAVSMIPNTPEYVTFELLLHAAFVAGESWVIMLEPARMIP